MTRLTCALTVEEKLLAVIPARGGSKGLPGKNLRSFAGLPLIAHSILFAGLCRQITRCVVSTDAPEIAEAARQLGADVPFLRPNELARDDTPLWPVVRHALQTLEQEGARYEYVVLLDPTSPAREPSDLNDALRRLQETPSANGVIGVSRPEFNPVWHCVIERDGWMTDLWTNASRLDRRQDAPAIYRINGSLYLWQASFVRTHQASWREGGKYLMQEIPEQRAMSIDTLEQFERAELLVTEGLIVLPWLAAGAGRSCAA